MSVWYISPGLLIHRRQLHLQCLLRHMIKAEVEGSVLLLLAAGCNVFKVGSALGVEELAGLSNADTSIAAALLFDFFFFVMLRQRLAHSPRQMV